MFIFHTLIGPLAIFFTGEPASFATLKNWVGCLLFVVFVVKKFFSLDFNPLSHSQ